MPVITTNTAANSALRYLNVNSAQEASSISKLASGSRITQASDDAAGLAIGTRVQSDVTVLQQASTNASHGSSILQAADGGAARISDILQRLKSLTAQSLSGAVTDTERTYIDAEYQQLIDEIDDIATGTRFNGQSLLDGSSDFASTAGVDFLVGTDAAVDMLTVSIDSLDTTALTVAGTSVGSATAAQNAATAIDVAIDLVSTERAELGAQMSRFDYRSQMIETSIENLDAAQSAIMDVDVAEEQSRLAAAEVLTQSSISALAHANGMSQRLLDLMR